MELRNNEQRAKNAILLIWIVLVLEVVSLVSSYLQYDLLQTITNGGYISEETVTANDNREQIISIIYLIANIISAITFIMWFRRAYYNLHQKVSALSHSDSWAAGSWFVPIVNLYRPYQIMKEIYVKTKELLLLKGASEKVNYRTVYLGWWWTLWIINGFLGQIIFRISLKTNTVIELFLTTILSILSCITGIICALITIKVIKDYSRVEPVLFEIEESDIQIYE